MFTVTSSFATIRAFMIRHLVAVHPDYATWTPAQQEVFRAGADRSVESVKNQALHNALAEAFTLTPQQVVALLKRNAYKARDAALGPNADSIINAMRLALDGIGDDHLFLNESFADGTSLLDFRTVHDWDADSYAWRQEAGADAGPYTGTCAHEWARGVVDDRFSYLMLSMLSEFITSALDERASAFLDQHVPHKLTPDADHGKRTPQGMTWSMSIDAGGKEDLHQALTQANITYIQQRTKTLGQRYAHEQRGVVWLVSRTPDVGDEPGEISHDVVFSDPLALDRTRWTSLLDDARANPGDPEWLDAEMARETARHQAFLHNIYDRHPQGGGQQPLI